MTRQRSTPSAARFSAWHQIGRDGRVRLERCGFTWAAASVLVEQLGQTRPKMADRSAAAAHFIRDKPRLSRMKSFAATGGVRITKQCHPNVTQKAAADQEFAPVRLIRGRSNGTESLCCAGQRFVKARNRPGQVWAEHRRQGHANGTWGTVGIHPLAKAAMGKGGLWRRLLAEMRGGWCGVLGRRFEGGLLYLGLVRC